MTLSTDLFPQFVGTTSDLSNEDYHAGPGVSKSHLDTVSRSPYLYYRKHLDPNRPPNPTSVRLLQGTLAHCAILEPDEFRKRYLVGPDANRNTKEWKAAEAAATELGKTLIKPDEHSTAMRQAEAVRQIKDVADLFAIGKPEVSAYWRDEETQLLCKCRPDWVHDCNDTGVILVDVKTTQDASPQVFRNSVAKWRYHVQNAWYADGYAKASGLNVLAFVFVAVEMDWPYAASAMILDDEAIGEGRAEYNRNLKAIADCAKSNNWPGYSEGIEMISLPKWAFNYGAM